MGSPKLSMSPFVDPLNSAMLASIKKVKGLEAQAPESPPATPPTQE